MESVQLWKNEPLSPLNFEEVSLLDDSFYQSSLDDLKLENEHFEDCESKAEVASHILENLEKLVDLDELIKAEPSFLLDEKMLPLLDDMQPPHGAVAIPVKQEYYKLPTEEPNTTYLLNDFEKVYFELNHAVTLTPPQSPPAEHQKPLITTLQPFMGATTQAILTVPEKQQFQTASDVLVFSPQENYASVQTPQPDIALELAVVDELVRSTVEDMQWSSGPSSPESSSQSNFGDCSSSSSDDTEWVPESIQNSDNVEKSSKKAGRKRSSNKPYSPDDKKNRKKEQNKNAATRYRLKKKAEVEEILGEEKQLLDKHAEFKSQITDLEREIKYLKGLMRDLLKAKGVIN